MIDAVRLENLRGIRSAVIEGLTPLTVFVGPNGSGKSTVLDAILLGASQKPAGSAGYVVRRRRGLRHGARWLFRGGQDGATATVAARADGVWLGERNLSWSESNIRPELRRRLEEPEIHQHPGAIRQSARAIDAAVGRGVQVLLSTHSLELIDALLDPLDDAGLDRLSLHRLQLSRGGDLVSSRLAGREVRGARDEIKDDLR